MWNQERRESQRKYFQEQRSNPTGNFMEYITRIYYNVLKQADDKKYCAVRKLNYHELSLDMYQGIREYPDHDAHGIIQNCLEELTHMGYIHEEEKDHQKYLVIDNDLDYLLEGEHENYLKKYGITNKHRQPTLDIQMDVIKSQNEFEVLLHHMLDPEHHAYEHRLEDLTLCKKCDGHYTLRNGKFGYFYGCSNYPKCHSTRKVHDVTYDILAQNGLAIYEMEIECWKCHKPITMMSYFPYFDLCEVDPNLKKMKKLEFIRLSLLKSVDTKLKSEYPNIKDVYSKRAGVSYTGNVCKHCGALQGSTMALDSMLHELHRLFESSQIKECIVKRIVINADSLSKLEWEELMNQII